IAPDFEIELVAERVDHAHAHAVQSAGNFVSGGIEFAAGVQLGHHDLRGRHAFAIHFHVVAGNAAAVINDGDGVIDVNGDIDAVGVTSERFVHRVVDNFVDQVMQSQLAR